MSSRDSVYDLEIDIREDKEKKKKSKMRETF